MKNLVIGHLENRLMAGDITETQYKQMKAQYVEILFELYVQDIITYEELREKLNH